MSVPPRYTHRTSSPVVESFLCDILIRPPPQFCNTHEGHTQMEYVFVYSPAVVQYIIYHVLHNPGDIDGWGECLHFEQECIPIGCLPPEHNRMRGVSLTDPPDRDPLDRDLPGQRSPWTETPWTEILPDRDPLDRESQTETPWTETCWTETFLDTDRK